MINVINGETPFQILSSSFSIGPSETGYDLQVGADSRNFTTLFSVGANTPRMVTNVANGSYFRLKNNVGDVKVNWQRVCVTEGGEGGSGTELSPVSEFPAGAEAGTVIAYSGSSSAAGIYQFDGNEWTEVGGSIDLSAYWTSAQTQSAITAVEDHLFDVEQVTASALTELHDGLLEVSGRTIDMSNYWTSAETKTYVDSAVTDTQNQLNEISGMMQSKELVISTAFNQLSDEIDELSGRSVDLSAYYTSAQTEDAISAATSGKADAASVEGGWGIPRWNSQGIIIGTTGRAYSKVSQINGATFYVYSEETVPRPNIYAPTAAGTAGQILVSTGNGAPVWSAVTFPDVSNYVTSAQVETQITSKGYATVSQIPTVPTSNTAFTNDAGYITSAQVETQILEKNYITSAATANMVTSTYVSTIWKGTQAEYDAITTKDPNTFYIIVNN